jgi:hypothetical protein
MVGFTSSMPGGDGELAAVVRRDDDARASAAALRTLGRMPHVAPGAMEAVQWALRGARDTATRAAAVEVIAAQAGDEAGAGLAALLDEADPAVVAKALRLLAFTAHGVADAAAAVSRLCEAADPEVRGAALAALARSGLLRPETLAAGLVDQSPDVRLAAVGQAPRLWSDSVAGAVIGLVSDPDARVRVHAMLVLKRRRLLTRALLEPLLSDPDEFVRRRAEQAASRL